MVALAAIYIAAARLGLMMDAVAGFATLVWPASGIALAALLTFGFRLWPGVFVGAFVANAWIGAPWAVALGIAAGNTLEAVIGAYLLMRVPGFRTSLDRVRDVLALVVLAAAASTAVSATTGVLSLYVAGIATRAQLGEAWLAWWVGDAIADLVVAPLLLVHAFAPMPRLAPRRRFEAFVLIAVVVAVNVMIFSSSSANEVTRIGHAYLVFPPLIWAALRFGQRGAVTTTFLTTVIAIWGTALGDGPFARTELNESLLALQIFMAVVAGTFLVLGASIAERGRAEENLRHAHATVAEANRTKSEFLAVMSHELRTPLNAISGYVELMFTTLEDAITEAQRKYLTRIRTNQQHLLTMIEDILSFAKLEAGSLSLEKQRVSVGDTLAELESLIEPELQRKEVAFTCAPCDRNLMVEANPERLRQILLNLLANAVKFTPSGGHVGVGASREADRIRMWVSDTGIGIPADQLERVFEPFFQVDRGTTRSYPGIGLGLAIARDLARAMGGDVRIESERGHGSRAWVELPAA
jgi:signal transduction histidine kinase